MLDKIIIRGAREHNLKNLNLEIPKNKLVVFTGVSGSGKSSLAMDTLYAEGQRRYVESLSSYARQFLGILPKPEVDSLEGLSPAIAIDQHRLSANPRSTVGTVTEIYDYLRVLFARIGHPHCPNCGREVGRQTSTSISQQILQQAKEKISLSGQKYWRVLILSPVVRDKRGEFNQLLENLKNKGFEQVRVDGRIYDLDEDLFLIKTNRHNIEVVVDKIVFDRQDLKTNQTRLLDDIEIVMDLSDGLLILAEVKDASFNFPHRPEKMIDQIYSSRFACPVCNLSLPEIEPRLFSFNSPFGACPSCHGLGEKLKIDPHKVPSAWRQQELENRYYYTTSEIIREEIYKLMIKEVCLTCQGNRLKKEALSITIDGQNISQICQLSLSKLLNWINQLTTKLTTKTEIEISQPLISQVSNRLQFLSSVGVDYLSLIRSAGSLSAGEGQRIRLAAQVGSGLSGILYILDEPTVGLHQRDVGKLIATLKQLRDLGNTLIVVEHEPAVIQAADWLVDFGPQAGKNGGQIVAVGKLADIQKNRRSLTGQYLSHRLTIPLLDKKPINNSKKIIISGCQVHNLKSLQVEIPLGCLVVVTGVSGSGKSSLVTDTLYPAIKRQLSTEFKDQPGQFAKITGVEHLKQAYVVDQSAIGRTPRSNPVTYIGVFNQIRQLFAQTREAKLKGFSISHFSFNTSGGRCEACEGQGQKRIQMQFLADIFIQCEECHGQRYKPEVLEVQFKDKNIAQVLDLTIDEALEFFDSFGIILRKLNVLKQIGLSYLQLGQPSPTLSGGESQRLKLARELVKKSDGQTIYFLDEPTTGLHYDDLKKLLIVLRTLVNRNDTVVIIEHNLEVIRQADWVIDLGPEGGEQGGYLVAQGTVEQIIKTQNSWTGKYLKQYLNKQINTNDK